MAGPTVAQLGVALSYGPFSLFRHSVSIFLFPCDGTLYKLGGLQASVLTKAVSGAGFAQWYGFGPPVDSDAVVLGRWFCCCSNCVLSLCFVMQYSVLFLGLQSFRW